MASQNINTNLAKKHGGKSMLFKDLPVEAQRAIIHYMAVDGEAWEVHDILGAAFEKCWKVRGKHPEKEDAIIKQAWRSKSLMRFYIEKYGHLKFGYVHIPSSILMYETLRRDYELKKQFSAWKDYHDWYKSFGDMPRHTNKNLWPCILSGFNNEVLEDGHHRFHRYVELGVKKIPCVYYLEGIKYY